MKMDWSNLVIVSDKISYIGNEIADMCIGKALDSFCSMCKNKECAKSNYEDGPCDDYFKFKGDLVNNINDEISKV